ncbi:MAG TPA: ATP F0F1 synthase subunit B [Caulobacteraceae bacterium]
MSTVVDLFQDAEFWVGAGLIIFLAVLAWAKAPAMIGKALDARGLKIQGQLDEARDLRDEAQALLAQITTRRAETERAAGEMLAVAKADAKRLRAEASVKLEEDIQRRRALAERRIAVAEAQASMDVKAAAADLATATAETILSARIAVASDDPLIEAGLQGLGRRFS